MLVAFAALLSFTNWRWGLSLFLVAGFMQDPLRKLAEGQPVYFVLLAGVVFGAAWLGAGFSRVRIGPSVMEGWRRHMGTPFALFVALVLLQAFHSYARFGSVQMTGIGLMVWLAPVFAVVLAYQFAVRRGLPALRRWMKLYVVLALLALSGVYLQYEGVEWLVLGEVGKGLTIYDVGTVLKAYSGFFRSSEIAAWHTATTAALLFILFAGRRLNFLRLLVAFALMGALVALGILTGRRKMLVEVVIFLSLYSFLVVWFQRGAHRLAVGLAVVGLAGWLAVVGFVDPDPGERLDTANYQLAPGERYKGYAVRGSTVFQDAPERFSQLGIGPVTWAISSHGWLGAGLGTGSQSGAGNESVVSINRGAAEGGLGKITMELGVPGLLLVLWLAWALARYVHAALAVTVQLSRPHARVAFALVALLAAKVASFSVAAQAYSDVFILLLLGSFTGFVLAMPVLARKTQAARAAQEHAGLANAERPTVPMGLRLPGQAT
ncbi:MAG: hypothetical protein Fur0019_02320 [Tibeticola sp.]